MKKEEFKRLNVIMEKPLHKRLKAYALEHDTSMSAIIKALILEEMNAERRLEEQNYAVILQTEMAGR